MTQGRKNEDSEVLGFFWVAGSVSRTSAEIAIYDVYFAQAVRLPSAGIDDHFRRLFKPDGLDEFPRVPLQSVTSEP